MATELDANLVSSIASLAKAGACEIKTIDIAGYPRDPVIDKVPVAVVPKDGGGSDIFDLTPYIEPHLQRPVARKGTARVQTLAAFIDLVNRHKGDHSAVFGDLNWRAPSLLAVIDYHDRVGAIDDASALDPVARHLRHRIAYPFPLHEIWRTWLAADGKAMTQEDFAEYIEEHLPELTSPSPAEAADAERTYGTTIATPSDMLTLSRGLEVVVGAKVKNNQRLQSGEGQILFETEHRDANGAPLKVPGLFMINVPVFEGGDPVSFVVRLRYRVKGGDVVWSFKLLRPDVYIDGAVTGAFQRVRDETALPLYLGSPEV